MKVERTNIDGVLLIKPTVHQDKRGFFMETYRKDIFRDMGINEEFVQDNHSKSEKDVLRGLHFQWEPAIAKLMRVIRGCAFIVAVDIRKNSKTLGRWVGVEVSEDNKHEVWAPVGFATGFCVLSDMAEIIYKYTGVYNKQCESEILWNDPEIGIDWPVGNPVISERDSNAQMLSDWLSSRNSDYFTV